MKNLCLWTVWCLGAVLGKQPDWGNLRDGFQPDGESECHFPESQQTGWNRNRPDGMDQPQVWQMRRSFNAMHSTSLLLPQSAFFLFFLQQCDGQRFVVIYDSAALIVREEKSSHFSMIFVFIELNNGTNITVFPKHHWLLHTGEAASCRWASALIIKHVFCWCPEQVYSESHPTVVNII